MGRKNHTRVAHVDEAAAEEDAEVTTRGQAYVPENAALVPRGRRRLLRRLARLRASALGQYLNNYNYNYNTAAVASSSSSSSLVAGGDASSSYYYGSKKADSHSSEQIHLQMASVVVYGWLF